MRRGWCACSTTILTRIMNPDYEFEIKKKNREKLNRQTSNNTKIACVYPAPNQAVVPFFIHLPARQRHPWQLCAKLNNGSGSAYITLIFLPFALRFSEIQQRHRSSCSSGNKKRHGGMFNKFKYTLQMHTLTQAKRHRQPTINHQPANVKRPP